MMAKRKFLLAIIAIIVVMAMCFGTGCVESTQSGSENESSETVSTPDETSEVTSEEQSTTTEDSSSGEEPDPEPVIPTHIDEVEETGLNLKTISIKGGETYALTDYPVTLPANDCNFFLAEMLVSSWPCNLTIKATDTADEDNYFVIRAKISKRVAEREGEEIEGPDGMIEFTYQKAGGEESEVSATILAYWENMGSGGTTIDSFTGYIWQLQYDGGSGRVGCFNVGSSFLSTDGFSAEKVTLSISSDVDVKIGLRYFGDTLNWDYDLVPATPDPVGALVVKTVTLEAGATYTLTDYPVTLPANDCNFFLAEMYVSNDANIVMHVADAEDETNYFELYLKVEGSNLTMTYKKAGGEESAAYSGVLAHADNISSGGSVIDNFTGKTIQIVYNGASANIGLFNIPASFVSLDGFTAENVIVSFSSDAAVNIGIRYFGDTLNWKAE